MSLRLITVAGAALLVVAACGGSASTPNADPADGATSTTTATTATPTTAAPTTATATTTTTAPATTVTEAPPPSHTEISFQTEDGLTLEGRLYPAGSTFVVLGHMFPSNQAAWFGFAQQLQGAGYSALTYNNRGYGGSDDDSTLDVGTDALAAVAAARANGAERVVYMGASMNGAAALFVGARDNLAGVVSLSGVLSFQGTNGIDNAPLLTAPVLLVAAEDDPGAVPNARAFFDAAPEPRELLVLPSGGHGTDMLFADPSLAGKLIEFVESVTG